MPQIRKPPTVAPAFNHYFSAYGKKFCALAIKVLRRPTLWFLFQLVGNANAKSHCSYAQWSALGPLFNPLLVHFQAATTFRGRLKFLSLFIFIKYSCTLPPALQFQVHVCVVCVWRGVSLFSLQVEVEATWTSGLSTQHSGAARSSPEFRIQDAGSRNPDSGALHLSALSSPAFQLKIVFHYIWVDWFLIDFNWARLLLLAKGVFVFPARR